MGRVVGDVSVCVVAGYQAANGRDVVGRGGIRGVEGSPDRGALADVAERVERKAIRMGNCHTQGSPLNPKVSLS